MEWHTTGVICFVLLNICLSFGSELVDVQIPGLGICQGLKETVLDKSVDVFRGIPFAKPPIGPLRFKAPEPIQWSGVLNATSFGPVCPQKTSFSALLTGPEILGEEDCLSLNVYRPSGVNEKLAAMFWIHGGGYSSGSGREFYDGSVLAAEYNVIVVTINYRLGVLGFFNIPNTEIKGNYGMLDQITALRWVKKNIASFGGDPERVTIFGESAGGASVSLHTLSPLIRNENLFQRAIMQSGLSTAPWAAYKTTSNEEAQQFGISIGCPDLSTMTECMRGKTLAEMMSAQETLSPISLLSGPNVDGYFLDDLPWDRLQRDEELAFAPVEQMIGFNSDEGTMMANMYEGKLFAIPPNEMNRKHFEEIIKYTTAIRYPGKQDVFHKAVLHEYASYSPSNQSMRWFESSAEFFADYIFINPADQLSRGLTQIGKTLYRYKFSFMPKYPLIPLLKVAHGMEFGYVFGSALTGERSMLTANYTDEDKIVSRNVMKMWTDFAKNGNPGNNWPKYTKESREYLDIGLKLRVMDDDETRKMAFWNELAPHLSKNSCNQAGTSSDEMPEMLHGNVKAEL